MRWLWLACAALFCGAAFAADPDAAAKGGPGGFPRTPAAKTPQPDKDDGAPQAASAPTKGSMPKGDAPKGKLGTEPASQSKLGVEPKPADAKDKPPRPN